MSSFSKIHLGIALTIIIAGCKDPATDIKDPCFVIPGECNDTGETGTEMGETGETGGGGPDALGVGECVFNPNEGKIGKQYNCFGELHTSLDLAIAGLFPTCEDLFVDDDSCSDDYYFDYEPQRLPHRAKHSNRWCEQSTIGRRMADRRERSLQQRHVLWKYG